MTVTSVLYPAMAMQLSKIMRSLNLSDILSEKNKLLQAFSYALALVSEMPGRYTRDSAYESTYQYHY